MAKALADGIKEKPFGRDKNLFDYMVLESIDYPTEPLERFFERRYGPLLAKSRRPLAPTSDWENLSKWLPDSVLALPKSQVYETARATLQGSEAFKSRLRRLREVTESNRMERAEADLQTLFGGEADVWHWLHLAELWDYLAPQPKAIEAQPGDHNA